MKKYLILLHSIVEIHVLPLDHVDRKDLDK